MSIHSVPPLVTISVDYALAPEFPFPLGIIESLSVIEFLMSANPNRKIHLSGCSAGAAMAIVAGLEAERKYSGRVGRYVESHHLVPPFLVLFSFF
jgi:acetyl esterase/lipase